MDLDVLVFRSSAGTDASKAITSLFVDSLGYEYLSQEAEFSAGELIGFAASVRAYLEGDKYSVIRLGVEREPIGKEITVHEFIRMYGEDLINESMYRKPEAGEVDLGVFAIANLLRIRYCSYENEYWSLVAFVEYVRRMNHVYDCESLKLIFEHLSGFSDTIEVR